MGVGQLIRKRVMVSLVEFSVSWVFVQYAKTVENVSIFKGRSS